MQSVKCATNYCRNETKGRKYCSTCRSKQARKNDAIKYSYITLKNNAKRRGIDFSLTLNEFKKFCYETDYIKGKGKTSQSYSVDRKEADIGYHYWNLQMLTVSENAKKGKKILLYNWEYKHATVVDYSKKHIELADENPF